MAVELGRNHNKQHLLQFSLNTVSIVSVRFTGKVFISTPVSQAKFSISTLEDTEPFHTRGQCRGRPHALLPMQSSLSSPSYSQGEEVRYRGTHFWCEAPYLHRPMTQRVGAGLGRTWSVVKIGATCEPLGIGSSLNAVLAAEWNYEQTTSQERYMLHCAQGKELPKQPLDNQPDELFLPPRLKKWKPEHKRQLSALQNEAGRLGTVLSRTYYPPPDRAPVRDRRRQPKILSASAKDVDPVVRGKDELNYRTVPVPMTTAEGERLPMASALLFPSRQSSKTPLRLHRNLSLPMSVVGELLTRDGKIAPIVPRAWKLAAAERPSSTRGVERSLLRLERSLERSASLLLTRESPAPDSPTQSPTQSPTHSPAREYNDGVFSPTGPRTGLGGSGGGSGGSGGDGDGGGGDVVDGLGIRGTSGEDVALWQADSGFGTGAHFSTLGSRERLPVFVPLHQLPINPNAGKRVVEPWEQILTDKPWIASKSPNLLSRKKVPAVPRTHDRRYRKSAMPIAVSALATH